MISNHQKSAHVIGFSIKKTVRDNSNVYLHVQSWWLLKNNKNWKFPIIDNRLKNYESAPKK